MFYIYRNVNDIINDDKISKENEKTETFLVSFISMKLFQMTLVTAPVA